MEIDPKKEYQFCRNAIDIFEYALTLLDEAYNVNFSTKGDGVDLHEVAESFRKLPYLSMGLVYSMCERLDAFPDDPKKMIIGDFIEKLEDRASELEEQIDDEYLGGLHE